MREKRRSESQGRPACTCRTARAVSPDGTVVTVRKSSAIGATTRLRSSPSTSQWHRQRVTTVHQRRAIRASTLRQPAQPSYFSGPFLPSHAGQPSVHHANQPCSWHAATGSSERACTSTPHSQSAPPKLSRQADPTSCPSIQAASCPTPRVRTCPATNSRCRAFWSLLASSFCTRQGRRTHSQSAPGSGGRKHKRARMRDLRPRPGARACARARVRGRSAPAWRRACWTGPRRRRRAAPWTAPGSAAAGRADHPPTPTPAKTRPRQPSEVTCGC